jgi:hypothetical protein
VFRCDLIFANLKPLQLSEEHATTLPGKISRSLALTISLHHRAHVSESPCLRSTTERKDPRIRQIPT